MRQDCFWNLLKSLNSIGQGRMRTQVQELPDTCFRKTNEMQHHGQKGILSMKTKAKQKCSPVVAQNLTMVRRSSVWSVLLEKEKIDIIVSWWLSSPMSVDKFFINANFSWSCRVAILITPPPLLPSSPCFFSVKISLRCPSGSCWRNHCKCIIETTTKQITCTVLALRLNMTHSQWWSCRLTTRTKVLFIVHLDPRARNIGNSTANYINLFIWEQIIDFFKYERRTHNVQMSSADKDIKTTTGTAACPQPLLRRRLQHTFTQHGQEQVYTAERVINCNCNQQLEDRTWWS